MKTVTVREVQHHFARVLETVEAGEAVEVVRRGKPIARIVPLVDAAAAGDPGAAWEGHAARLAAVWEGRVVEGVDAVLDDLRGGR